MSSSSEILLNEDVRSSMLIQPKDYKERTWKDKKLFPNLVIIYIYLFALLLSFLSYTKQEKEIDKITIDLENALIDILDKNKKG